VLIFLLCKFFTVFFTHLPHITLFFPKIGKKGRFFLSEKHKKSEKGVGSFCPYFYTLCMIFEAFLEVSPIFVPLFNQNDGKIGKKGRFFLSENREKSEKGVGSFCLNFYTLCRFCTKFRKKGSVLFVRFSFFLGFIWVMLFKIVIFVALKQQNQYTLTKTQQKTQS